MAAKRAPEDRPGAQLDILLVEDEPDIASSLAELLMSEGHSVDVALDGAVGLSCLREDRYDLMISDLRLPEIGGLELFEWVRSNAPSTAVVLMSAYGSIPQAVSALRRDAVHFLAKPFELDELIQTVEEVADQALMERLRWRLSDAREPVEHRLIGQSPLMAAVKRRIATIAACEASILIHGETGTGKEVAARAIHAGSSRRDGPFVAVNCGALPPTLIESELFGHEKGAFTGASRARAGSFKSAHGGTLFLDEITEMPRTCQVKLLRALQEGMVRPVGGDVLVESDVRVLAATNRDIQSVLDSGELREDLFYRLKVLDVHLPPLRDRVGDLPLLVSHFLDRYSGDGERQSIDPHAWALLRKYPFPGNVRELEHAIHHAVIMSGGAVIEARHLPSEVRGRFVGDEHGTPPTLAEAMAEFEQELLVQALDDTDWCRTRAAERLGISRKNLWEKLKKYGIAEPASTD